MTARTRPRTVALLGRRRPSERWLSLLLLGLLAACTGETKPTATEGEATMYQTVIQDLVDRSGVELSETLVEPVVFIEVLDSNTIDLDTQIMVIDGLREEYSIRFIDDIIEAVLQEEDRQPVRPGTILIVFGPIDVDETLYTLHAEYYRATGKAAAFNYHFENRQSVSADRPGMVMTDSPQPVDPLLVVTP